MARRFGRNLENPERRIENEGKFSQEDSVVTVENPYDDEFEKKLEVLQSGEFVRGMSKLLHEEPSKREEFMKSIKVEQTQIDTPVLLAYQELDRARQSGDRDSIIKAEDHILDLEREEEEKGYNLKIKELREMQKSARDANDVKRLAQFKKMRQAFLKEMKYDELNYKIRKLQNSQRLQPSKEKLQQIMELKRELEELEMGEKC